MRTAKEGRTVPGTDLRKLIDGATAPVTGTPLRAQRWAHAYQVVVTGTGAVTASCRIQVSLDRDNWIDWITISVSGTTTATDGASKGGMWQFVRAVLDTVTGTGASVDVLAAVDHSR